MKRDDIINAAISEFGENDYNNAKIDSIIAASKTSKGTFYHYFKSKEDLYLELVKRVAEKKIEYIKGKSQSPDVSIESLTIFEILFQQIRTSMEFALKYPQYAAFGIRIANETNMEIKGKLKSVIGNISGDYFKDMVKRNVENGVIRDDIPYDILSGLFSFMLVNYTDFISSLGVNIHNDNKEKIYQYLEYYISFLENGLKRQTSIGASE